MFFLFNNFLFSQKSPTIITAVDSTKIKIGEQINYKILVEADSTAQIVFPEGQTFSPLEMVEEYPVDTLKNQDKFNLIKKYALTQFDSGHYTIPKQRVLVNNIPHFTDSLLVEVASVQVDTTKQKMYDIKPLVEVEKQSTGKWVKYALWSLLALLLIGFILYWFVFRKKPLTEEEKIALLPPYDRALLELKNLDESKYLIQSEYKEYYSELTNIVRSYIEDDVHISALESTTDELINKLEMLKDAGSLKIDNETIKQFQRVLKTADLVKFAKSKPDSTIIESDRKAVEQIVVKTKEAIPEPTEEELLANEQYLAELEQKKQRKKIIIAAIAGVFLLLATTAGFIGYYGFKHVKDTVIGHPTKELLEGEWIYSEYGYPSISIETPKVLKRIQIPYPEEAKQMIQSNQAFAYGSMVDNFYILVSSLTFNKGVENPDLKSIIENTIASMEKGGAKNVVVKEEKFTTSSEKEGLKAYGSMDVENKLLNKTVKSEYVILNFAQNGGFEQVIITYKQGDRYAEDIVNRIINSIDFKTQS
ncbi:hypothetical protein [Abyssalbus ytuae]